MSSWLSDIAILADEYTPTPLRLRLSSIAGSIALACWLVLIIPQLVEMWRVGSVDGISPLFLVIWTVGDVANVAGSIMGRLLPEVILTGVWFLISDLSTVACYYYIKLVPRPARQHPVVDEETPLVAEQSTAAATRIQSHNSINSKKSLSRRHSSTVDDVLMKPANHSILVRYGLPLLFVICAGVMGSFCSPNGTKVDNPDDGTDASVVPAQVCGYISATMYLTARIPQILKNHQNKSCKGLSLLFFLFSTLANLNYGLQILFYRSDWAYVKLNSSWLLGSLGTIFEDVIIFVQFYLYN